MSRRTPRRAIEFGMGNFARIMKLEMKLLMVIVDIAAGRFDCMLTIREVSEDSVSSESVYQK